MSTDLKKNVALNLSIDQLAQIRKLCKENSVNSLYAFGSVTSEEFTSDSDVDLIIDIDSSDPEKYSQKYFEFKFQLQAILDRDIDLIEKRALRNPILLKKIEQNKIPLHEA